MTADSSPARREDYYADYWSAPELEESPHVAWKARITREHPRVVAARSILDVGCGAGAILASLGRGQGSASPARLVGVEVSPDAVAAIRARGLEAEQVDLEQGSLPFPDATFDVVLCYDVFEHLFAPQPLLREIRRVLSPRGAAMLCVPNTLNAFNRLRFALGEYVDVMDTSHRQGELFSNHIRLFSRALFEKFLSGTFRPVEKHYYFPERFSDSRFKLPGNLARVVTAPRLHERAPSLFALGFLYVCEPV